MTRSSAGNRIELFKSGAGYFPALASAIDSARAEVHLQTYIYEDDSAGRKVAAALIRAAQRGVAVRVLLDGFGSKAFLSSATVADLRLAGARVLVFRPWQRLTKFRPHRLRRMHRKLAVIDGRVAFVGGINIVDDFEKPRANHGRLDYAVSVEGPLLEEIHGAACSLWGRVSWSHFKRRWRPARRIEPVTNACGGVHAALLLRDNLKHRREIENAYLDAIQAAKSEVFIANAYFFPSRKFREALAAAVARGVRVVLLLQGKVEYWFQHYAARALYADLLSAGIEIHEYHLSYLHAKVAVIDAAWLTVGSSNIEPLSLLLAKEANIVVRDNASALVLRDSLMEEMKRGARQVIMEQWETLPMLERILCRAALRLARLALAFSVSGAQREYA
ncbi:MAG: cardiolipin synthase ClsB [Betaproteobacteria bacterium]|nr:cardiolipin synthase ClsB [Betaproteobacteria bacterium]